MEYTLKKLQNEVKNSKQTNLEQIYNMLVTLINNIISNPTDEKYKIIKSDNKKLKENLFNF